MSGAAFSERKLRRRRSILLNMLRAGVSERRRLAFTAELRKLNHGAQTPTEVVAEMKRGATYQEPVLSPQPPAPMYLAAPDEPHQVLSDAQLTVLLRDVLASRLSPSIRPLLKRVSWQQREEAIVLVCTQRDLALVIQELRGLAQWAVADLAVSEVGTVTIEIGEPKLVSEWPEWLDADL